MNNLLKFTKSTNFACDTLNIINYIINYAMDNKRTSKKNGFNFSLQGTKTIFFSYYMTRIDFLQCMKNKRFYKYLQQLLSFLENCLRVYIKFSAEIS